MKLLWILLAVLILFTSVTTARTDEPSKPANVGKPIAAASPCVSEQHGRLDFWLGDWDVTNAAGAPSGTSHVERILDGCVVMENWTSVKGGYAGRSFNTFDTSDGHWTQHWVDNGGLSALMTGEFHEKNLVYRRSFKGKDGKPMTTRMTFFDLGPGKVRQLVERSSDGGKTWATQFDLRYSRSEN